MLEVKNLVTTEDVFNYFRLNTWKLPIDQYAIKVNTLGGWIFRGHKESKWDLTPNAFRFDEGSTYTNLSKYIKTKLIRQNVADLDSANKNYLLNTYPDDSQQRINRVFLHNHRALEAKAVYEFVLMADRLGISTSLDSYTAAATKEITVVPGIKYAENYNDPKEELTEFPPQSLLESFALAQHHGVPTRLLDWTQQPLVALYFACKGVWDSNKRDWEAKTVRWEKESNEDSFMAIWALHADTVDDNYIWALHANPSDVFKNEHRVKIFSAAYSRNGYLKAQSGVFTIDTKADDVFTQFGYWEGFDKLFTDDILRKVYVKKSLAKDILKVLYVENNLSPVHISPSLDKIKETYEYYQELFLD